VLTVLRTDSAVISHSRHSGTCSTAVWDPELETWAQANNKNRDGTIKNNTAFLGFIDLSSMVLIFGILPFPFKGFVFSPVSAAPGKKWAGSDPQKAVRDTGSDSLPHGSRAENSRTHMGAPIITQNTSKVNNIGALHPLELVEGPIWGT
jgi:hypothetical protein